MADNFDIHAWKFTQLITEGVGTDLAKDMVKDLREKFRTMSDEEVEDFKKELLFSILLDSEYEMIYPPEGMENINEGDDRCTRIAKSKYDVWPSAYASGAVVRCRKGEIWKDEK